MKRYGLIGFPLSHSFSKKYFSEKFSTAGITNCSYENFEISSIDKFPELISSNDISGLSVTIPYKQEIIPFLDKLSVDAEGIGAVNTIKIDKSKGGLLIGHNTDVIGFRSSLLGLIGEYRPDALVLGTGGAAKAVIFVLKSLGINAKLVSRKSDHTKSILSYSDLSEEMIKNNKLIINTTPLGMFPNTDSQPALPYDAIGNTHFLFDLTYNPVVTSFLRLGHEQGASIKNGQEMLELQADAAWEIWNSK